MSNDEQKTWLLFREGEDLFILHPEMGPCRVCGPFGSLIGPRVEFRRTIVSDADESLVLTGETITEVTNDLLALGWSKKKIRKLLLRQENVATLTRR